MMTLTYWIAVVGLGLVAALNPVAHQTNEESLRSALNAVTRKQRSLNPNAPSYYANLSPFKYRDDNGDRKLERQQVGSEEIDDNEESLAFLPSDGTGQLETIGGGYQHLNNKQFGRALMDYLQYSSNQEMPAQSIFRERERTGSHKRGGYIERGKNSENELERLLLEELENNFNGNEELPDAEYQRNLGMIYDEYRNEANNNIYGDDPTLLSELLREEDGIEEDPRFSHITSVDRRNVNSRYPLFSRDYNINREITKRFPVSKRSAQDMNKKRGATDPKVAQDLGALFGIPPNKTVNHTQNHDRDLAHEHNHDHVKGDIHAGHVHDHTSEIPNFTTKLKNFKENSIKSNKIKERTIEVKKKSVDWSQYFGIDRRKKTAYLGRSDTQDQDDEYLLQKYYERMAEILFPIDKNEANNQDKIDQINSTLLNMKTQVILEALKLISRNNTDSQEIKEEIISHLSMAYSIEKLRRALMRQTSGPTLKNSYKEEVQNNLTGHFPTRLNKNENEIKHKIKEIKELQDNDNESYCPQIDVIERRCKATEALIGDFRQKLHIPCVAYHICRACDNEGCLERFALEAQKICQEEDLEENLWPKKPCVHSAMLLPRYIPSISPSAMCNLDISDSCRTRYRYFMNGPFAIFSHHRRLYDPANLNR